MDIAQIPAREVVPASEYILQELTPISHLTHGWELHSSLILTPAEERTMVREPAQAIPRKVAERLGKVRVLLIPYVVCLDSGDAVSFSKPKGETHSAVWLETEGQIHLLLAARELGPHDTGFEFLASVSELLHPRLFQPEMDRYSRLLDEELQTGIHGEIDEDALAAKQSLLGMGRSWRRSRSRLEHYRDISFVSTMAEYMHGLWHDVQIHVGPDHLPFPQLRSRMSLLEQMFPPNPGYHVFSEDLKDNE